MEIDEVDNVQYGSGSIDVERDVPGPIPSMETHRDKKHLDPSLMKALKLFAKNH